MGLDRSELEVRVEGVERAVKFLFDVRETREERGSPIELHRNQYNQVIQLVIQINFESLLIMEQEALANILKTVRHKLESKSCSYDQVLLELHALADGALRQGNQHLINQIHNITKLVTVLNSGVPCDKPSVQPPKKQARKLNYSRSIQSFSSNKEIQAARKARAIKLNRSNRYSNIKVLDEYSPDRSDVPLSKSILQFQRSGQKPRQEKTLEESRKFMRAVADRVKLNNELTAEQFQQLRFSYQKIQNHLICCSNVEKNSTVESRLFFEESDSIKRLSQRVACIERHLAESGMEQCARRDSEKAHLQFKSRDLQEIQRRIRTLKDQRRQLRNY